MQEPRPAHVGSAPRAATDDRPATESGAAAPPPARRRLWPLRFAPGLTWRPAFSTADALILLGLAALVYAGARLAFRSPQVVAGPNISLEPRALPWYALLSLGRMAVAYLLSFLFSLAYGYGAARSRVARLVLMPLLDVLQSVPILSFLPVALLGLSAVLPAGLAAEIAAILLIFTSQAWNMTFSFYQSLTTQPRDLVEAAAIFRLGPWRRFRVLELPFAGLPLVWNSMMSWAGGWFFLMAAEIFHVGTRDFRLPGLGSYLQVAAARGDLRAVLWGVGTLVTIIVLLDQLVWRPLLAWADRFKVETVEGREPPSSWFLEALSRSWVAERCTERILKPLSERVDRTLEPRPPEFVAPTEAAGSHRRPWGVIAFVALLGMGAVYGGLRAVRLLETLPAGAWGEVGIGLLATAARVGASLGIALVWTVPVGVLIATNRRLATVLQPIVQVAAAVPATALFPVFLLFLVHLPGGLNAAAILLMLMGTQWYLLFNVIAGAAAVPQDLRDTTALLGLSAADRWRFLVLPALFPYLVTGAITASGGAWNASIVAERVEFGGRTVATAGIGEVIARATSQGDYALLLASTLALVVTVVAINRAIWLRLYRMSEERFRLE